MGYQIERGTVMKKLHKLKTSKKKKDKKKSVRLRLILGISLLVFIPVVIANGILYMRMNEIVGRRMMREQQATTRQVISLLENAGNEAVHTVEAIAELEETQTLSADEENGVLNEMLTLIQFASEHISDAFIYIPNNTSVGTTSYDAIEINSEEWLSDTMGANGEVVFSQPYSDVVSGATTMAATMRVDQAGGDSSIVGVQINMREIAEVVDNSRIGETGYPFVITDKGYWQFTTDNQLAGLNVSDQSIFLEATGQSGEIYNDFNDRTFPIYYERVPEMNLIVYGAVTSEEMAAERSIFVNSALRVVLISIIAAILIAILLSNYLVRITRTIQNALFKLQNGELKTRIHSFKKKQRGKNKNAINNNGHELHQIG